MSIFKCKMCGGDLEVTGEEKVVECEYCGSKQTVPNADDEKKVKLFNRANRLRMSCEFDKAAGIYEQIVAEFPEEAEAYWGLCLANYGIEYVDDPATGDKIPTCHRASFEKMRKDENYELALENADMAARIVYEDQAREIDRIMGDILAISRDENPYDVFICYKETDSSGSRTLDSVLAQEIYDALCAKGYRVFFSRITLEDKLGTQYEPYIFSALNSAKMMLVVGTDYEYMNAVWVKNEWSRFIKLMAKDKAKVLIPCYKDMDPYDMPDEFRVYQSQDCGKVGFMQDLTRGIDKIFGKNNTVKPSGVVGAEGANLVRRGNMALEDEDFEGAESYFERALDINPSDARAYLGKFLAAAQCPSIAAFGNKACWLVDTKEFKRAEQFADSALAKELKAFRAANDVNIERLHVLDAIKQFAAKKMAADTMQLIAQCTHEGYQQACAFINAAENSHCIRQDEARDFRRDTECRYYILKYLKECKDVCSFTDAFSAARDDSANYTWRVSAIDALLDAGMIESNPEGYCWPGVTAEKEEKERFLKQECLKQEAIQIVNNAITEQQVLEGIKILETLGDHEDSAELKTKYEELWRSRKDDALDIWAEYCSVKDKISAIEVEISQKTAPTEKMREDIEKANAQLRDIKSKSDKIDVLENQLKMTQQQLSQANSELSSLGMFAFSKKKEISARVDELSAFSAKISDEISQIQETISETCSADTLQSSIDCNEKKISECINGVKYLNEELASLTDRRALIVQKLENRQIIAILIQNKKILPLLITDSSIAAIIEADDELRYMIKNSGLFYMPKDKQPLPMFLLEPGDETTFGHYHKENENDSEPIEWLVLDKEDGKIFVISKYALDCQEYNTSHTNATWEDCSLRKWMNSTFFNNAFSAEEQAKIQNTIVSADINPEYSANPSNATTDKVFLLSIAEVDKYFSSDSVRTCKSTKYAVANGANVNSDNGNCWWWLRSSGSNRSYAAFVDFDGTIDCYGNYVSNDNNAIRPAMWISF